MATKILSVYFSEKAFAVNMSGVQELRVEDVEAAVKVPICLLNVSFRPALG